MLDTILSFLSDGTLGAWITAITAVVTAATAITMITPTKTDDRIISKVLGVLNFLAGNVIKNKNADDA